MAQFTTFAGWKSAVESHTIRTDFPTTVYSLAEEEIYENLRVVEMRANTTLSISAEDTTLPTDFIEVIHAYIDTGGIRYPVDFQDEFSKDTDYDSSGIPQRASIINDTQIRTNPTANATYTMTLRYYARPAFFTADADTNDVLSAHNRVYLYAALRQFAIWEHNAEMAVQYEGLMQQAIDKANKKDMRVRYGTGPLRSRARSAP